VKPIHLNLASRPYRDYRPVYAAVVVLSVLTALLMLENIDTYYRYKHETRGTSAKIEKIEADTQQERQREEIAQQRLKGLDLARLSAQTKYVNAQLSQRAFSWSTLLDELESVLADDVRILSISPGFTETRDVRLSVTFQTKSADGMLTTINQMNADPQFKDPFPSNETQVEGGYQFNLNVLYTPPALTADGDSVVRTANQTGQVSR
jgi:type IV pilus assembly protein PilN